MNKIVTLVLLLLVSFFHPSELIAGEKEEEKSAEKKEEKKKTGKIYAIKDRYGNITGYTDDPNKGEEIKIRKGTEYSPPESPTVWTKVEPKVVEEEGVKYTHFAIASPTNDATIRNNAGNVQVAFDIRPPLQPGHRVQLLMDGKVISESRSVIQSAVNVDRGAHSISAKIIDASNKTIRTTSAITVHVKRATAG